MHEAALSCAAFPAPSFVLCLELRPYSLAHELMLIRERNPLAFEPGPDAPPVTRQDLCSAVWNCTLTWEQKQRDWCDPLKSIKIALWRWRVKGWNFRKELQAFIRYRENGLRAFPQSPLLDADATPSRSPGAPFVMRLQQFLVTELSLSQAQAWDFSYGVAVMQWQSFYESEGRYKIENVTERAHLDYVAEMDAKEAAAIAAAKAKKPRRKKGAKCPGS